MSCVTNLTSTFDRFYAAAARRGAARKALLDLLLDVNHACVHPLNHNYVAEIGTGTDLYMWAVANDLIGDAERRAYHGF